MEFVRRRRITRVYCRYFVRVEFVRVRWERVGFQQITRVHDEKEKR